MANINDKIGILGGGQLGKMLIQEASKLNLNISILDKDPSYPAGMISNSFTIGSFNDYNDVMKFGANLDIITIEIENVNVEALKELQSQGKKIRPSPFIIETIKDKGIQKQYLVDHNIQTSPFQLFESKDAILQWARKNKPYPFVQKLRTGGYDGKGVQVIGSENELDQLLEGPSIVEDKVQIQKELSILVARSSEGEVVTYDPVEMQFDHKANLLDLQIAPAIITPVQKDICRNIATTIADKMKLEGLLAIELFLNADGQILVNEMAPRPHNSGHQTIEANVTSQYAQLLRAITNMPLGSTKTNFPSVLLNLLGSQGHTGPAHYNGLADVLKVPGVYVHIYGKETTKPFRKMGHITIVDSNLQDCLSKAALVKQTLNVISS